MKKILLLILSAALVLGMLLAIASCTETPPDPPDTDDPTNTPTNPPNTDPTNPPVSDGKVYIFKDGKTDYALTYATGIAATYANKISGKIKSDYWYDDLVKYVYTKQSSEKEIVIGDTDRAITAELKAAANAQMIDSRDFVWAYGYKDGQLGFYANSEKAFEYGWDDFFNTVMHSDGIYCDSTLWKRGIVTYEDYKAEQDAIQAAEDKKMINKLKTELYDYVGKNFGTLKTFTNVYGDIDTYPNRQHPRLYVNSSTLPTVIKNLESDENSAVFASLKASADYTLTAKMPTTAYEIKSYSIRLEELAFMYLVTGNEKYGYGAILRSLDYINALEITSSGNAAYHDNNTAGHAFNILAEVYDWCYDLFTEEQKEQFIAGACNRVAKYMEIGYPPAGAGMITGHGSEYGLVRNWLAFAVAIYDEHPEVYEYVAARLINQFVPGVDWYYQSGVHHQGSAYGTIPRLYPAMAADMIMHTATGKRVFDVSLLDVAMTHINRLRPDGQPLRIGDDYNDQASGYLTQNIEMLAFFAGSYYGDAVAKAWYKHFGGVIRNEAVNPILSSSVYLIYNNPDISFDDDTRFDLELVHYNGSPSGSMVVRSAWGDEGAWLTYTDIEEANAANHDHMDAGTFQIYYKGILAPGVGVYNYNGQEYGSKVDYAYTKQTISKNGLLIYNPSKKSTGYWIYSGGQSLSERSEAGSLSAWENLNRYNQAAVLGQSSATDSDGNLVYAYISGDITGAYDSDTVDLVTRSTMSIATNDPEHPLLFLVYDRIISDDASFKKTFVLHTMEEPTFGGTNPEKSNNTDGFTYIAGSNNSFYYTNTLGPAGAYSEDKTNDKYNGKLTTQTLLPENPEYRYVGGDGKRFWVNGENVVEEMSNMSTTQRELGWGRVEISPAVSEKENSFLNVMYVGDAKDAQGNETGNELIPATLIKTDTHEGAVIFNNVVMFAKSQTAVALKNENREAAVQAALVSSEVSFTAQGTGEMNYYVTGLKAGKWTLTVAGEAPKTVTVTADSGLAAFKANAGVQVTLTPN